MTGKNMFLQNIKTRALLFFMSAVKNIYKKYKLIFINTVY